MQWPLLNDTVSRSLSFRKYRYYKRDVADRVTLSLATYLLLTLIPRHYFISTVLQVLFFSYKIKPIVSHWNSVYLPIFLKTRFIHTLRSVILTRYRLGHIH